MTHLDMDIRLRSLGSTLRCRLASGKRVATKADGTSRCTCHAHPPPAAVATEQGYQLWQERYWIHPWYPFTTMRSGAGWGGVTTGLLPLLIACGQRGGACTVLGRRSQLCAVTDGYPCGWRGAEALPALLGGRMCHAKPNALLHRLRMATRCAPVDGIHKGRPLRRTLP